MEEVIGLLKSIDEKIKDNNELLRRLVYLFEKYDVDVFESEEIARDLQGSRTRRRS
jgi:hypothetical protein